MLYVHQRRILAAKFDGWSLGCVSIQQWDAVVIKPVTIKIHAREKYRESPLGWQSICALQDTIPMAP